MTKLETDSASIKLLHLSHGTAVNITMRLRSSFGRSENDIEEEARTECTGGCKSKSRSTKSQKASGRPLRYVINRFESQPLPLLVLCIPLELLTRHWPIWRQKSILSSMRYFISLTSLESSRFVLAKHHDVVSETNPSRC